MPRMNNETKLLFAIEHILHLEDLIEGNEWEETPELLTAIDQLQKSSQAVKDVAYKPRPIHGGNVNFAPLK